MEGKIIGILVNVLTFGWKNRRKSDIALYHKMKEEIPLSCDSILLLKNHDFSNSFPYERLKPLNFLNEDWRNIDCQFHNRWVERRKNQFLDELREFLDELNLYTAIEYSGFISIGLSEADKSERKNRIKVAKSLNNRASKAYEKYEIFIKVCKKRFHQ